MTDSLTAEPEADPLEGRFAVTIERACRALDIGKTRLYELLDTACADAPGGFELESYLENSRNRRITARSIRARIDRRLAEEQARRRAGGRVGPEHEQPGA